MAGFLNRILGRGGPPLQLDPFLRAYPPQRDVAKPPAALVDAYRERLPAALVEVWERHGLGFYGRRQELCLVDPSLWQPVLDRWIVSPPDAVARIPIAITAFNAIIYYRRLTATDEDISALDPTDRSMNVLNWSLLDFFNTSMLDKDAADALVKADWLEVGRKDAGPLKPGEVFEADPVLLPMQMLKVARVDAIEMHKRLRHEVAIQTGEVTVPQPSTIAEALPDALRPRFADNAGPGKDGLGGLYFTSQIDRHRLLDIDGAGKYRLLLWSTDPLPRRRYTPRYYEGPYKLCTYMGDRVLELEMEGEGPGSDRRDDELVYFEGGGRRFLAQGSAIGGLARNFGWNSQLRSRDEYFLDARLDDALPEFEEEPVSLTWEELPASMKEEAHRPPLRATVVEVRFAKPEDGGNNVLLDKGEDDGIEMNMRLGSTAESGKDLFGWASGPEAKTCWLRLSSEVESKPEVGDVVTTRSRKAEPW